MQTVNIFISKKKIIVDNYASTKQLNYLISLCFGRGIDFPFESIVEAKWYLRKYEANRAIKELLAGNSIAFIYPID